MDNQELVRQQYETASSRECVDQALRRAGLGQGTLNWSDLVPLDQFHVRGLGATRELAEVVNVEAGSEVLDIGCGLGGPARFLAATYGCRVTGIDLSQPFIDVATTLTDRCGLKESVLYQQERDGHFGRCPAGWLCNTSRGQECPCRHGGLFGSSLLALG